MIFRWEFRGSRKAFSKSNVEEILSTLKMAFCKVIYGKEWVACKKTWFEGPESLLNLSWNEDSGYPVLWKLTCQYICKTAEDPSSVNLNSAN